MSPKRFKPTSPGRRNTLLDDFSDITRSKPEKSLVRGLPKRGGRNNTGRITVRHRGGGHARRYRLIDFDRRRTGEAEVMSIEYDPNRSARISLVRYEDGVKRYVITPQNLAVGSRIANGNKAALTAGNSRSLGSMPPGTLIHNIEVNPGKGGKLVRAAGASARIMAHESNHTLIEFPSGERRNILSECFATVGVVSNPENKNFKQGKAGRMRHRGRRPTVRGSAMSPNSHPHGGGEGRAKIGLKGPKTPTGKPALGVRTRRNRRSDKYIIKRRYARN